MKNILLIILTSFWLSSFGVVKTWNGAGLWSNPLNWIPVGVPGPDDDVVFDMNEALKNCTLDINTTINKFSVIDPFYSVLRIESSATIFVKGDICIDHLNERWENFGTIELIGDQDQQIYHINPVLDNSFYNLVINKTGGSVILETDVWVDNSFVNLSSTTINYDTNIIYHPALPIILVSYGVSLSENGIEISWTTNNENNNDYFVVERSIDCISWETLTTVKGQGYSSHIKDYKIEDPTPYEGNNYYRLKQVDFDGTWEIFPAKAIAFASKKKAWLVYPNPAKDWIYIQGKQDDEEIKIVNYLGQVVLTTTQSQIFIGDLTPGFYFLICRNQINKFKKT